LIVVSILAIVLIFIIGNYIEANSSERKIDPNAPYVYKPSKIPSNMNELDNFVDFCMNPISYDNKTSEASSLYILEFNKDLNVYEPSYKNIDEIKMLNQGQYISFNMNLTQIIKDNLQKGVLDVKNNEIFNLCIVSSPLLDDNVHPVMPNEGIVFCLQNLTLGERHIGSITSQIGFVGFIPESDFFSIKTYLIPYEKIPEIQSKKGFNDKKMIVESYTLLNEFEKKVLKTE